MVRPAAIPQVPIVGFTRLNGATATPELALRLDGMDCIDCTTTPGTPILYGGGAFQIDNLQLNGALNLQLEGAAWNTFVLLNALHIIGCPTALPRPDTNPNRPGIQTIAFTGTRVSLSSPVGTDK